MLTHTIRALILLGLIAVAHTVKPFSLENLTSFSVTTASSIAQMLPAKTLDRLTNAGMLAALVTGNWGNSFGAENLLISRFTDEVVASQVSSAPEKAKLSVRPSITPQAKDRKRVATTGQALRLAARRDSQSLRGHTSQWGGAPLPYIPGLESSLMPSTSLMFLPQMPTAIEAPKKQLIGSSDTNLLFGEPDCEQSATPLQSAWSEDEVWVKPLNTALRGLNFKVHVISARPVSGQACAQPAKGTLRSTGSSKQSC